MQAAMLILLKIRTYIQLLHLMMFLGISHINVIIEITPASQTLF